MTETQAPPPAPVPDPPSRRRVWLPRIVAVLVLVAAVLVAARLTFAGEPSAAERSTAIGTELKQKMITTLESLPPSGHAGHGGAAAAEAKLVCGARVYGWEPEQARSIAEVRTVYGFHMCASAEKGMTWFYAPKLVAPLVMRTDVNPPAVEMAESGPVMTYQESLRKLIPERYQKLAVEGALEPGDMEALQKKFEKAVS